MTVLSYHSIDADWDDPLAVDPAAFATQMQRVAAMRPLALPDYIALLRNRSLPRGAVAVTFDDGYRNNLALAAPICARLGIAPAIFLAVGHVDSGEPIGWRDQVRPSNRPLDWSGARALSDGGWTVGSHTYSHRDLVTATAEEKAEELTRSRSRVEEMLGRRCDTLSYPYGRHDATVREAAEAAGYDAALTLPTGREYHDVRYAIPRIGVFRNDSPRAFRAKLSRAFVAAKLLMVRPHRVEGSDEKSAR